MRKSIAATLPVAFPLLVKTARLKGYCFIAIVFLPGCTATVVRWNSVKIREEIMAYYNDEIMDNLIRMKNGLPFVHVDISSVSAAGVSQVSGTVGGGDTESFTRTSPTSSMMGVLHTITRAAMTPFAYSATPLHSDTLTMTAVPVIGPLSADSQGTTDSQETEPPELDTTKITEVRKPPLTEVETSGTLESRTIEKTPKPAPTTTIYQIYRDFLCDCPGALVHSNLRPSKDEFVPGTLKMRGTGFYYIQKNCQAAYTKFCERLFAQSRGKPSTKTLKADVDVIKAQGPLVPPTSRQP